MKLSRSAARVRRGGSVLVALVLIAGFSTASAAAEGAADAPANDNFENAVTITGVSGSVDGTTVGATTQPGEPDNRGLPPSHSVWYSYTPTADGTLIVDTCENTTFFSTIGVHTGTAVGSLAPVSVHPNGACAQVRVAFNVTKATAYRIAVDVTFGDPGPFTLGWAFTPATAPLLSIGSDAVLNCFPQNVSNDWLQFFSTTAAIPTAYSCATLVSVPGVGLFGPPGFADSSGLVAGQPLHSFAPVAQSVSAHRVRTTVSLPGTALSLVQTETYRRGTTMQVDIEVHNSGGTPIAVTLYRTGDCFPGDDIAYAIASRGSVGCEQAIQRGVVALPSPGDIFIRFQPLTPRANTAAADVSTIRTQIAAGTALPNACDCGRPLDPAAALSWSLTVPSGRQAGASHLITMSTGEGRDSVSITGALAGRDGFWNRTGRWYLTARVATSAGPVRGAVVDFTRGSLLACRATTDRRGYARCRTTGHRDIFTATYFGDTSHGPASTTFGRVDRNPPRQPPTFPACAQFDPGPFAVQLNIVGHGHYSQVVATTLAPPCPTVLYRARSNGVVMGEMRGDLRATDSFGTPTTGFALLYLSLANSSGCLTLESIDLHNGAVVDKIPSATSGQPCLHSVGGQKFR